jgi:hypothetical protein
MGEKSRLYGSIDNSVALQLGFHMRRYSTPDFTFMGIYLKYGFDLTWLFWQYRNPVISETYNDRHEWLSTDTISTDGLFGTSADVGLGWSLLQLKHALISAEILGGGTLFWFKTFQGFKNDLYRPDAYLKASIEIAYRRGEP